MRVYLREMGDGNLGTKNTYHVLGLKPALWVGALDIGKGALATWLAKTLSDEPLLPYLAAFSAVHVVPDFEGGVIGIVQASGP